MIRDQFAGGMLVEKMKRHVMEVGVNLVAQVANHALADHLQEIGIHEKEEAFDEKNRNQP